MNKLLTGLVFMAAPLLAACGGDQPGYDDATRDQYVEECLAKGGDEEFCQCIYDAIVETVPFEDFNDAEAPEVIQSPEFQDSILACAQA